MQARVRGCRRPAPPMPDDAPGHLTTLTLNIGAAAPPPARAIERWLRRRRLDVLVLPEPSSGAGTALLRERLRDRGYDTYLRADRRDRGVLVATRLPVLEVLDDHLDITLPWRGSGVLLDTRPTVGVIGVYVPSRDRSDLKVERKRTFIASLLASLRDLPDTVRHHLLLAGDYNAVARDHQPRLPGFFPYEYDLHDTLAAYGLAAAHMLRPGRAQPHSWIGRTGIG